MIKLLLGGSPCTYWSIAKTKGREVVANHNYPDIIQHGDAFQIREWKVNDEETGNSRNVDCKPNCFGRL